MKRVTVIGMGLGAATITDAARQAIERAEVICGAPRVLSLYPQKLTRTYPCYLPQDVAAVIAKEQAQEFAVLVSGDTGFYSAAAGLAAELAAYDINFVPGISTVNAFFAQLKLPWQEAAFISVHGRAVNVVDTIRRHRLTFCLSGNNINEIGAALSRANFGHIKVFIGENLGTEQERVYETVAECLTKAEYPLLNVLLFVNETFDNSTPCGLPDSSFMRLAGLPMTKSETRAVILSKLNLRPSYICWDIGAGSGSVTVEMALSAYLGKVYAVERRADALALIQQNCAAFHLGNAVAVCGEAPALLETLPVPDAVFVGGSGGQIGAIVASVYQKNPQARLVVAAITIETVYLALAAFKEADREPEITQLSVSRAKPAGQLHLLEAQNPLFILSAGAKP